MGFFSRKHKGTGNGDSNHNSFSKKPFAMMMRADSTGSPSRKSSLPDVPLPRAPDPNVDPAGYLRSIYAVRERSRLVLDKGKRNQLRHFNVDMSKFPDTAHYIVSIIKVLLPKTAGLIGLGP